MSYMIILEPSQEAEKKYIQASQSLFSERNCGYLLKEGGMPHITICQFECDKEETAKSLWENIRKIHPNHFSIHFVSLSLVVSTIDNNGYYWAELTVSYKEELFKLHNEVTSLIKSKGLSIINDYGDDYRPHLTLARIQLPYTINKWPKSLLDKEVFNLNFSPCIPPSSIN